LIAKIGKSTVLASNAGVAAGKCWQVANGALYVDPSVEDLLKGLKRPAKREWVELHDAKLDLLEDLIDELQGSPLLVAYQFQHDLARLQRKFGSDIPYIGAGVAPKRTIELEQAWNRGELPVLLGHPQSVGHGLNLQGAGNHVCWFSMTYDYDLYDQFLRRVLRQGNLKKHVFVHHIIANETVDQLMRWALGHKGRSQAAFLDALRAKRRK
jgi:SNF2 family DNA or RNA helicase